VFAAVRHPDDRHPDDRHPDDAADETPTERRQEQTEEKRR
jgi:hypothetical protein